MKDDLSKKIIVRNQDDAITQIKIALSLLGPLGTIIDQAVFEHHGRIKQNRVNKFCEAFIDYLKQQNIQDIAINEIDAESFGDMFELIIRRVSQINSQEKIEHFKRVLAKQIITPKKNPFAETYIDLVGKLDENQIIILAKHLEMEKPLEDLRKKSRFYDNRIKGSDRIKYIEQQEEYVNKLQTTNRKIKELSAFRKADFYNLPEGEFLFYIQDLASKSLLFNPSIGLTSSGSQFGYMKVTEYGRGFLEFIQNET